MEATSSKQKQFRCHGGQTPVCSGPIKNMPENTGARQVFRGILLYIKENREQGGRREGGIEANLLFLQIQKTLAIFIGYIWLNFSFWTILSIHKNRKYRLMRPHVPITPIQQLPIRSQLIRPSLASTGPGLL